MDTASVNVLTLLLAAGLQDPNAPAQDPAQGPQPMQLPATLICRRGDRRIDVDGSLMDWPELPVIELSDPRQLSGTANGAWRSPDDLSGFAFAMWDEKYLWFAAAVKDEWHRPLDPKTFLTMETPAADSILLTIDPLRNTRALGPDRGRDDDVEFWLGDEASHLVLQWDRLRGHARLLDAGSNTDDPADDESRLVVSHDKEKSITSYEMCVAWSSLLPLGVKPAVGSAFDMQVVISDFDETTDPMPQTRIGWTFGCGPVADPGLYGTAVLIDDTAPPNGKVQIPPANVVTIAHELQRVYWFDLAQNIRAHPPTVHDGSRAPEAAGGTGRLSLLEELDYELGRYPRVDFVEFCMRAQRQMMREVAGIEQSGVPSFWDIQSRAVAKAAAEPAAPGTARLYRLPQNGWLVRGEKYAFLVDPAGAHAASLYWGATDFVLLTEPLDPARRSDPMLLRMADAKPPRPYFTHIVFHLPRTLMQEMPLVAPGDERPQPDGVIVRAVCEKRPDGRVPSAMGYLVSLPGRIRVLFAGSSLRAEDVPDLARNCQCLVLTARNPQALEIAAKVEPELVLVDGAFACSQLPNVERVSLAMAHALQRLLIPTKSLLLAPGESWEITATH